MVKIYLHAKSELIPSKVSELCAFSHISQCLKLLSGWVLFSLEIWSSKLKNELVIAILTFFSMFGIFYEFP